MQLAFWVRGVLLLGWLAGAAVPVQAQDDLSALVERALASRSPDDLAEACSRLEDHSKDRKTLAQLYTLAGVKPLAAEASGDGGFTRLEDLTLDDTPARVYKAQDGELYLVLFRGTKYRTYFRTEGTTLVAKIGGFGPLRSIGRVASADPKAVLKAVEKATPDLRILEELGAAIRKSAGTEREGQVLTEAAERLSGALQKDAGRVGLLEELGHVYDRLGEVALGTSPEPEYRRLQIAAAVKLAEALPDATTTRRSLALAYFRLGAYPLAAEEAARAKDEPLAQDLALVLRAWSQADHEKVESFEVDGSYRVDLYRTKAAPPESSELFAELTFIVRRPKRPEFAVYTLSSQKLKTRRHYYIYFWYLGQRTLLTTYAERRPGDGAAKEKVSTLIRRLSEGPK